MDQKARPQGVRGEAQMARLSRSVPRVGWVVAVLCVAAQLVPAAASAADPLSVTLVSSPNPSIQGRIFTLTITVSPVPDQATVRVDRQVDDSPWFGYREAVLPAGGIVTQEAAGVLLSTTTRFRAFVLDAEGAILGSSAVVEQGAYQQPTSLSVELDATTHHWAGTITAKATFTALDTTARLTFGATTSGAGAFSMWWGGWAVPAGDSGLEVELPLDRRMKPGGWDLVVGFIPDGLEWAPSDKVHQPVRIDAVPTSLTLSTEHPSMPLWVDFDIEASVGIPDGLPTAEGTISLAIDDVRVGSADLREGRVVIPIGSAARSRLLDSGIGLGGRHTVTAGFRPQGTSAWSAWLGSDDVLILWWGRQQPPVGSVTIEGGAVWTRQPAVSVAVPATDALEGVAAVRLANDPAVDAPGW